MHIARSNLHNWSPALCLATGENICMSDGSHFIENVDSRNMQAFKIQPNKHFQFPSARAMLRIVASQPGMNSVRSPTRTQIERPHAYAMKCLENKHHGNAHRNPGERSHRITFCATWCALWSGIACTIVESKCAPANWDSPPPQRGLRADCIQARVFS